MKGVEPALQGQGYPPQSLLDFRYRERFHLTQRELEEEPLDVFETNLAIMGLEHKVNKAQAERLQRQQDREIRQRVR